MEQLIEIDQRVEVKTHILCTNLNSVFELKQVEHYLNAHKSIIRWTIDLLDCDKVLKVISISNMQLEEVSQILAVAGFFGKELED